MTTPLICAICLDDTEAATIINGTAVCRTHIDQVGKHVNNAAGPPAFQFIRDPSYFTRYQS